MVIRRLFLAVGLAVAISLLALVALPLATAQAPGDPICRMYFPNEDGTGGTYTIIPCPATPTLTPTRFPTWTPVRTATLEPTHTVTPTRTPTVTTPPPTAEPTPTPELTPLPPTFTVTPKPTKVCTLRANGFNINARQHPSVTANVTGLWGSGEEAAMGAFSTGQGYLWGHHDLGWSVVAVYTPGAIVADWWVDGTQAAALCTLVEGWPDGLQPPAPIAKSDMAIGFFCMPNCNAMEIVEAANVATSKGITPAVHPYANPNICLQVMDVGGVCSYRPGAPDCPQNIFIDDPRASAREFMENVRGLAEGIFSDPRYSGKIWIDVVNECGWGDDTREYAWWAEWMDEYITQAATYHWPPLQLPSLGPGYGNELMFATWADVLNKLDDHGGLFAMHVYNPIDTWLCPVNEWLADRTLHNWEIMQRYGIDVGFSLTEVGQGWGNTPPNISDMVCHAERQAGYTFIVQYYVWENGYNFTWFLGNWEGFTVPFIQALDATVWG